ncbi:diphosphomevalonate decarboxylase [Microbacterium horticulturae]|uniref:diphosphomevalonate decarboxylase n=1 Tax=Microbacterium horticulturae TaxID=3028316 RepID=A0ABY8BZR1_9MICO|nr:diphosphomevalonate decarboxylase [Microbacterium sp. KACC 23027]WEG09686.1 diphosphomevalonate decarboxylase [Microbacterium sp. KACC 23027]
MTSTAVAHPNIALVKYWGKRDDALILPDTGSLSLTLDVFPTTTSVTVDDALTADEMVFDGAVATGSPAARITTFLDLVRAQAGRSARARVDTRNSVPTGAGLASSASGFAALAVAAADAYGLDLAEKDLSRLARRGSGSACRSIIGGTAIWHAGLDDATSYAEHVSGPDLGMVIAVVDATAKAVSSREAMQRTKSTSPYASGWVHAAEADLLLMQQAFAADDVSTIGAVTESNALRMHAAIMGCRPPIRYLAPQSIALFDAAERLRRTGLEAYATADAGPNVVFVCRAADVDAVRDALIADEAAGMPADRLIAAHAGPGAHLIEAVA